jgi:hypothetical protein
MPRTRAASTASRFAAAGSAGVVPVADTGEVEGDAVGTTSPGGGEALGGADEPSPVTGGSTTPPPPLSVDEGSGVDVVVGVGVGVGVGAGVTYWSMAVAAVAAVARSPSGSGR